MKKSKKSIIKACVGKGGCGKGGLFADTVKEIPKTVAGMGKNIVKAMDPGNVAGLVGRGIKGAVKSLAAPTIKYNKFLKERDDKWRQEGEDMMNGRERYVPSLAPSAKQGILKDAIRKAAPMPNKKPIPGKLKPVPMPNRQLPPKLAPKPVPMPKKAPYIIPDQSKLKNIGVGWGGEKPSSIKK